MRKPNGSIYKNKIKKYHLKKLLKKLKRLSIKENIVFVHGKGRRKSLIQKAIEKLNEYITKMAGYSWQLIYQIPVPYGKSIDAQKIYEKIRTERKKRSEQHSSKSN